MTHDYTRLKAGLNRTVGLWEKRHGDETKTEVVIEDQTDNVADDDAGYVISAVHMSADGRQERFDETIIDYAHGEDEAHTRAENWMADNPQGLSTT